MATRFVFTPYSAEFPSASFPQLQNVGNRPVLSYDDTSTETARWSGISPCTLVAPLAASVFFFMASASSGSAVFQGAIEAVTPGDSINLSSTCSFDTATSGLSVAITASTMFRAVISFTSACDSMAAYDYFRVAINRMPASASDTAVGDAHVVGVVMADGGA